MSSGTSSTQGQPTLPERAGGAGSPSPGVEREQKRGSSSQPLYVVLTGNPNCGKTTLFNALTGLRAKVGNYAGVTVERKEGRLLGRPAGFNIRLLDLPGTYSLSPQSMDEQISRDVLLNRLPELPPATLVIELGYPSIVALNMVDVARKNGHEVDARRLADELGTPVIPIVATEGIGLEDLRECLTETLRNPPPIVSRQFCDLPKLLREEVASLATLLGRVCRKDSIRSSAEALLIL